MRRAERDSRFGLFQPQFLAGCVLCGIGVLLGLVSVTARSADPRNRVSPSSMTLVPQPTWSVSPSGNMANNTPTAVTCVNDSDCWTVGSYIQVNFTNQTLAEHWNGTRWSIVASPNTNATENNILNAVTCVSTSDCWAVGEHGTSVQQTLTEHWNGSAWTIVSSPNSSSTKQNYLAGVACSSTSDCWAVGFQQGTSANQTLIEHWNGTNWSIVMSPDSSTSESNTLNGVTCVASNDCWTVGSHAGSSASDQTLTAHWNGTAWSITMSPNTSTSQANLFAAVTCTGTSNCWATGYYDSGTGVYQTLTAQWNGTVWTIVGSPNSSTSEINALLAVACASGSDCWSVGVSIDGNQIDHTLTEHWNGSVWSIMSSPNEAPGLPTRLQGVACTSGTSCWGIGYFNLNFNQTVTERWNGASWSIIDSPNIGVAGTSNSNAFNGIACVSGTDCWAVGFFDLGNGVDQTLTEHWDGVAWSIFASANTAFTQSNNLGSITCVSSNDCWAAGDYNNGTAFQPLTEHWNGTGWTVIPAPSVDTTHDSALFGVACASSSDCWTVGVYLSGSIQQTLIEHWNGMNWTIVMSPDTAPSQPNQLNAVTCTSSTNCWAVGSGANGVVNQTLTAHWDGMNWSVVRSGNTSGNQDNFLYGVSCLSAANCWAVGAYDVNQVSQTLTEHWDGSAWTVMSSPNTSTTANNTLNSVACTSTSDCIAAGGIPGAPELTLIEQWNGSNWTIVTSPSPAQSSSLSSVACASATDCFAVGLSATGMIEQTLVEKRTVPPLSISSVARPTTGPTPGQFTINGIGVPNSTVTIFATPDLTTSFDPLNSVTADGSGNFHYTDTGAATIIPPRRFYRAGY